MSKLGKIRMAVRNFFEEKGIETDEKFLHSRLHRIAHFWLLVCKSFKRNRCPVRAASLSYTTLLALVPLLAVAMSITTSMLKKGGEKQVEKLIEQLVTYIAPALDLETRSEQTRVAAATNALTNAMATFPTNIVPRSGTNVALGTITNIVSGPLTNTNLAAISTNTVVVMSNRDKVVKQITAFIANIRTGTLTTTSALALLFVGISLLRTIEATFNDIWGVTRGRGWVKSIVYYWATITLCPLFLVGALTLTTGP